jgi:cadmium resistance protein CadD (predicted permease)
MTMTYPADRNPLQKVAGQVTKVVGILSALATSLVGYGIVTAVQGDAVTGLLGTLPGLLTLLGTAIAAFKTANKGEEVVTPVADPRDNAGTPLVPAGDVPFTP